MSRSLFFGPWVSSLGGCGALALILLAGCGESTRQSADAVTATSTAAATSDAAAPKSGKELLQQLATAYRQAVTYTDQGVAHVQYKLNGKDNQSHFPFSVTFAQPNRIWVKAYEGEVVSDGKRICAIHESVHGYVRTSAAPDKLTVGKIYGDEFLWSALNERQAGGPLQLEFLLNEKILDSLLAAASGQPELLEPGTVEQALCHRVRLTLPQGKMVFWIQQGMPLLRRVEYPIDEIRRTLEQDGQVTDLAVTADFASAKLNEPLSDDAFRFEPPAGAKEVKQFVGPSPADVLGQKPSEFEFTSLADGQKITPASLAGKVVVLDFWATWCEYCLKKMPDVAKVYDKYKANDKVRFIAVSIDQRPAKEKQPSGGSPESQGATDEAVKAKLADLKIELPIARDGREVNNQTVFYAFSVFKVPGIPARIVLGPDGTVQAGAVGLTAEGVDPVAELSGKVDALLAGKNLYAEMIAEFEKAMQQPPPEPTEPGEAPAQPEVKIVPRSEPKTVKLTPAWTCGDLPQPGNLLVIAHDKAPKLLAIDAFHSVAEINPADGKVIGKHTLKLPENMAAAFLRTAVDGAGKRYFAASAVGQQQVFVFDDAWQPLGHYPPKGVQANVGDVQLVDLDGDGTLELCVGFLQRVGVHAATLQGQKLWAYEKLSDVVSLTPSAPDTQNHRRLWCVHAPGKVTPLDHQGTGGTETAIGQRAVRWLVSAKLTGETESLAGFAYVAPESNQAQVTDAVVGVDLTGKDLWTYPLPTGQPPWLEQLAAGRVIGEQRHWIAAAADGSLHFVSSDGKPLDQFQVGAAISGFTALDVDGKPLLVIAVADKLQAWRVDAK